jgi:hypothetical protein
MCLYVHTAFTYCNLEFYTNVDAFGRWRVRPEAEALLGRLLDH